MKTVIIFGGSGFIGQNIICRLVKKNYRIIVPYQRPTNEAKLRSLGNIGQIIPLKFIKLKEDLIQNIIHESDVVLNLKTIWQEKKSYLYKKYILDFIIQLTDLINLYDKNKPLIFFSGLGVSENSLSLRAQYIAKAEKYINQNLKNYSIIKPSIVIGKGDQFLSKLLPLFKFSKFIPLFNNGDTKLQPVFIEDVAKAIEIILEDNVEGNNIFELVGPEILTYKSLYQFIADCLGLRRNFVTIPFGLASIGASIIEKTPINLITTDQLLLFKEDNISTNMYKNFNNLGISPNNVREIIKNILLK